MSDKIGCFIIDIAGTELTPEDIELLRHPLVGGIIFFARNYQNRAQLSNLCSSIRKVRQSKLLIMVDQEGGRVQRFQSEFTRIPPMATFGQLYDENHDIASELTHECGWLMAAEMLSVGIDLSLAPVLDIYNADNKAIGNRAFHKNTKIISQLAAAFISGMHEAGMAATGKHFPGHGSVNVDSHIATPIDKRTLNEIENKDLIPFAAMIKSGIDAIMAAHIVYPEVDKLPVGFSRIWLKDILRQKLQFNGIIFSDDLNMEGANVSVNYADRVQLARDAGCDFVMLCNNRKAVIEVIDNLIPQGHFIAKEQWGRLAGNFKPSATLSNDPRWQSISKRLQTLGNEIIHEK